MTRQRGIIDPVLSVEDLFRILDTRVGVEDRVGAKLEGKVRQLSRITASVVEKIYEKLQILRQTR